MASRKISRTACRPKKKDKPPIEDRDGITELDDNIELSDDDEESFQFIEDTDKPVTLSQDVLNFIEENELMDTGYTCSVYKFLRLMGKRKELCKEYEEYIPTGEEIGLHWGGGRYEVMIKATDSYGKNRIFSRKINLHSSYDKEKAKYENSENNLFSNISNIPQMGNSNPMAGLTQGINLANQMMNNTMGMILPLIQSKNKSDESMNKVLLENFTNTNDVIKQASLDNTQFLNDAARNRTDLSEIVESEQESTGVSSLITMILPLLNQYMDKILAPGVQSKAVVNTIKQLPDYKKVINDEHNMKQLVAHISKEHGPESAIRLCNKFKIEVPEALIKAYQTVSSKKVLKNKSKKVKKRTLKKPVPVK